MPAPEVQLMSAGLCWLRFEAGFLRLVQRWPPAATGLADATDPGPEE